MTPRRRNYQFFQVILTTAIVIINCFLVYYTIKSNNRASRVFVAENRPLIDVTPIAIVQNPKGTHTGTLLSITNYSGFTAFKVGVDLKYGENSWIGEWVKAEDDAKTKGDASGVVKGTLYLSSPHIQLKRLEAGETQEKDFGGIPVSGSFMAGSLNLEEDVVKRKEGLPVVVRSTWQNEKGHVFDAVHEYRLVGTTNSAKGRSFTFIPKGIVSQKDAVGN